VKARRTFHGDDHAAFGFDHLCDHVVDEAVLVPYLLVLELLLILSVVDLLEDVFEFAVVFLQDGVLRGHVQGHLLVQRKFEACVRKPLDGVGGVVHGKGDAAFFAIVVDFNALWLAAFGCVDHLELAFARNHAVFCAVLVAEGMTADDDGCFPAGDETWDCGDDNGCAEDGAASTSISV